VTGIQAPRRTPHAEAVVHEQFDASAAGIGEEVAVVGLGSTEYLHHSRQQPIGTRTHVDRLYSQPHRVNADHRSSSRIHAAHSLAALAGQVTVIAVAPRCSSMRISATGSAAAGGGRVTGTNNGLASGASMPQAVG